MKKIILLIICMISALGGYAQSFTTEQRKQISDSLRIELSKTNVVADSVRLLYDLLDLARYDTRVGVAEELYRTSKRSGSIATELDVMRRLGALYGAHGVEVEKIVKLINDAAGMPVSDDQRMTLAFLRIQLNVINLWNNTPAERQKKIREMILDRRVTESRDPYDEVEFLFTICRYLQDDMTGTMVVNYFKRLNDRLHDLSGDNLPLLSQYYVQASLIFSEAGHHKEAIEACRKLLETIDQIEANSKAENHSYRSYDINRFVAYRRLLSNYVALTDEDIDETYEKIQELGRKNPDIGNDLKNFQIPDIYYLMGKKRYGEALKLLNEQIDNPKNKKSLYNLYPMMVEAATKVGDKESLLKASLGYTDYLKSVIEGYAREHETKLTLLDDVREISGSKNDLIMQQRESSIENHKAMLRIALCGGIGLILVIIVIVSFYIKGRYLTARLRQSNEELIQERDAMQATQKELIQARDHARRADSHKTEFINNMSHEIRTPLNALIECSHLIVDNMSEEKRHYLKRYADMIDVSADMLRSIVNDVLEIAAIDHDQVSVQRKVESADKICQIAVNSVRKHCHEGVDMRFTKPADEEFNVNSDPARIEQVLINLLNNGAKFTEEGYVDLTYTINPTDKTISFIVEDSGIGVPHGKEEVIFERFEKLSNLTSGTGLGLNISRAIATLLGGTIKVDTSYEGPGARFVFTLPIE